MSSSTDNAPRRLCAYRFALDSNQANRQAFEQHAGAARWAYNHAVAAKLEASRRWRLIVDELITLGWPTKQAQKQATALVKTPNKMAIQKRWNQIKGDETKGIDGICPWWRNVSTYAFQSAWDDADQAWKNHMSSLTGKRAGRIVSAPKFKKKGRARDSFTLYGANLRLATYRRLNLPKIGEVRMHDSGKRLQRALDKRAGVIKNVTISRGANRWYASVLVEENATIPGREDLADQPTSAQRERGRVGVNFGVRNHAALSNGELISNPRALDKATNRMRRLQQSIARSERGSTRLARKRAKLAELHHQVSEQRRGHLHQTTKRLATSWSEVALQDLDVAAMTASARGTVDNPGTGVKQKSKLNRAVLDASFGEFRRQIEYKAPWYGSTVPLADRYEPVDQTCAHCGATKPKLPLGVRVYHCGTCGQSRDRDINAALNIAAAARHDAPDSGESENARGDAVRPPEGGGRQRSGKT